MCAKVKNRMKEKQKREGVEEREVGMRWGRERENFSFKGLPLRNFVKHTVINLHTPKIQEHSISGPWINKAIKYFFKFLAVQQLFNSKEKREKLT